MAFLINTQRQIRARRSALDIEGTRHRLRQAENCAKAASGVADVTASRLSGHPLDVKVAVASALMVSSALACGARSEIAGGAPFFDDASMPIVDASPPPADVSAPLDGTAPDAETCTAPQVQVSGNGLETACKANVTWTCGDTKYRLGGGCDLPDAAWPDGDLVGAEGVCDVNGAQTTSFTTPTCSCDPSAWIALAKQECPGSHQ